MAIGRDEIEGRVVVIFSIIQMNCFKNQRKRGGVKGKV